MIAGTTPTIRMTINALDLTQCHGIHVTLKQRALLIDIQEEDLVITEHRIEAWLTQAQSLQLASGTCELQVNGLTPGGSRWATKPRVIDIQKQLLREVIS